MNRGKKSVMKILGKRTTHKDEEINAVYFFLFCYSLEMNPAIFIIVHAITISPFALELHHLIYVSDFSGQSLA